MYPREKGKKMESLIIYAAVIVSVGCYFVWSWADAYLFTYLGDVKTCSGIEQCYMYDALTWSARIVVFLCGAAAITVFILTWFGVYGILFL